MPFFTSSSKRASKDSTEGVKTPSRGFGRVRSVFFSNNKDSPAPTGRRQSASDMQPKKQKALTISIDPQPVSVLTSTCRFVATPHKLGSGAYGAVLLGSDLCTQEAVAIKFIPDGRMRTSSLEREVAILQRLSDANHPALVRFHGHVRPADVKAGEVRAEGSLPTPKPHTTCHALVMECVKGGELFDYVVKCEGLKEVEAAPLYAQLCDAVHAAHGLGIAHRDLKLENVLLVRKKNAPVANGAPGAAANHSRAIKLIDWGLAHQHAFGPDGSIVTEMLKSRCGSRSYMAPEVTNRDISSTVGYDGFAADVWSLGVCLFAIHLAFFPFEQANPEHDWRARRVVEAQRAGKSTMATILSFYPQKAPNGGLSDGLIALLDRMLVFNPKKRATLAEVLCSEWLAPHVPAACTRATIARTVSLASQCTTRSGRSTSVSSEGSLTPRSHHDGEPPLHASGRASRVSVERMDSTGTVCTSSSAASHASHTRAHSGGLTLPGVAADFGGPAPPRGRLPPPPPSPYSNEQTVVVVAGGRSTQSKSDSKHKHSSGSNASKGGDEQRSALEIARMLSKACKVTAVGSPRQPDRSLIL